MKAFSEVFPHFQATAAEQALVACLLVERVVVSDDMARLTVYVVSRSFAERAAFRALAEEMREQLFGKRNIQVEVRERFQLGGDFTAEQLFRAYQDSLLEELRGRSLLAARILERGKVRFPSPNVLLCDVEDMSLNRSVMQDLRRYLEEEVFEGRCGLKMEFRPNFVPFEKKQLAEVPAEALAVRQKEEEEEGFFLPAEGAADTLPGEPDSAPPAKQPAGDKAAAPKKNPAEKKGSESKSRFSGDKFRGERREYSRSSRRSDNPDVLYGRDFDDECTPISEITEVGGEVTLRGKIFELDTHFIEKSGSTLFVFSVTDYTDSITAKLFVRGEGEELDRLKGALKVGAFFKLRGATTIDSRDGELILGAVRGLKKTEPFEESKREDHAREKRVELHCHTKMSDLDAVSSAKDIIKQVKRWGMEAVAITDHGNLQAFPEAWHTVSDDRENNPKIIYGVEGYLVDDLKELVISPGERTLDDSFVVFDIETTGFSPRKNRIIEIGAVKLEGGKIVDRFSQFVNPELPIPYHIEQLTGINDAMVRTASPIGKVLPDFLAFCGDAAVVAHNASFDTSFIRENARTLGLSYAPTILDTVSLAHVLLPKLNRYKLDTVAKALGDALQKPVVATCDVHFLNPEDEIYRRMIFFGNKYEDADKQPPLYFRTTEEMLKEFAYLGPEKCEEVVIKNTQKIARMVERISPVRPDKSPPVIDRSDEKLTELCYGKAYAQYGNPLPEIVKNRLEKELSSIIKNGFAVMYIIAQELVKHSNEEGYLVGSRGSVGSSFVAYTAGITEVNPLPPHYVCPHCRYSDFDSEIPKRFAGTAGCDMPDQVCPHCGAKLRKDGFDIPFETFLGFKGDKEPDIDLNFSGENQSSAHAYTEVIFGKGQTFRAGTVGTLAEKTAFGYVKNYFEAHGTRKRKCEINRLVQGCVGVRRTTGQHPGGIVVLPKGESIYSFTPLQHPANDATSPIITTHFEYHAIDHNLLKLDILGHQDPTMIRMLQDLTQIDPVKDIPLDSPEVMSLFQSTEALGVKPDDSLGCQLGALGIPEFGTDFAMNMVIEAKPKGFSDLVRIAGLAHGTDVWQGNAEVLISEGTATIQTAICTRDDIMLSLIQWGMDPQESFKIMESVRKGKGLTPDWEAHMREHEVPDWYIWSCKKIKYMFPKAHAAAYVMMAWRIGYCKIFYPLAYYAAYFSIRATGFSYEGMCQGKERLEFLLAELKKRDYSGNRVNPLTPKEEDMVKDGRIAQEMYARGFSFLPIDLYRVKATQFTIVDGKIMPALTSIDGLGESAAEQIVRAAAGGQFISKDDFRARSGVGQTICDLLDKLGILGKLPESNQLSLFDLM